MPDLFSSSEGRYRLRDEDCEVQYRSNKEERECAAKYLVHLRQQICSGRCAWRSGREPSGQERRIS